MTSRPLLSFFFFFNDTATTEIYTLSLHDALPIFRDADGKDAGMIVNWHCHPETLESKNTLLSADFVGYTVKTLQEDRKSTRLNSSHDQISYAVFCLKKKKKSDRTRLIVQRMNHGE